MKCFLNILLVALVLVIAPLTGADAERKKTKKELAHEDCDNRYVSCSAYCDSLIDINNQVEICRTDCGTKFDSCNFWADRARVQGTTGNVGGTSGGVLDPGAGNAGGTGGATTGGFGTRLQKGGTAAPSP